MEVLVKVQAPTPIEEGNKMETYFGGRTEEDYKKETRTYSFTGTRVCLEELERMFKFMAACGDIGTSQDFQVFYDGDGSAHLTISRTDLGGVDFNTLEVEEEVERMMDDAADIDEAISFEFD